MSSVPSYELDIDWSDWLAGGDAIVSSTWTPDAGIKVSHEKIEGTVTTLVIYGGTPRKDYWVTNEIETINGRKPSQSRVIRAGAQLT